MDYVTENIKSLKTIISKSDTANYDWDIIVPDFKPDVGKIVSAEGIPSVITKDIMQDRAMVTGNIKINVLYIPYDNPSVIKNVETVQNFNYVMELSGLRQNMGLNILATTDKINVDIINSRKLHLNCQIDFLGNVSNFNELNYISEIKSDDILYKTQEISTYKAISENENIINLIEEIEVPAGNPSISEILRLDIKINNKNIKAIHDKIVVKGDLEIITVYNSEIEGECANYMCHEIPFTEIFDVYGVDENTICDAEFNLRNVTYCLKEDREGEKRIIQLELSIFIQNKSYEKIKLNSVVDAYSLKHNLKTETSDYMFDEIVNQINGQFSIKDTVNFGNETDIHKIININPKAEIKNVTTRENKVYLKGNILIEILYISNKNSEIKSASSSLIFEQVIECDGASEDVVCDLKTDIIKCAYNIISDNELELRVNMEYTLIIKRDVNTEIICNIFYDDENAVINNKSGISIYFCSGNENIWNIAKKYKTTVDEILLVNNIKNENEIKSGMKLLIP